MKRHYLAALAGAMLSACAANVSHEPLTEDGKATGIRYYDSAPYLLVYSDGKGGLFWQVLYLPDQTHIMVATPKVLGAHTEMTMNFSNGTLSSTTTIGDTTAIPKAIISAVQTALPALAAAAASNASAGFPSPYLYKLVVKNDTLNFIGGQGKAGGKQINIQVPIVTKASQ